MTDNPINATIIANFWLNFNFSFRKKNAKIVTKTTEKEEINITFETGAYESAYMNDPKANAFNIPIDI